jgi:hypothetical protein
MANRNLFLKSLATAASANNIALSQGGTANTPLTLNGAAVVAGVATIDAATATNTAIGRRVIVTSGGNDTGINFVVTGTDSTGNTIVDTFAGASGAAAQSNYDFVTVTSVVPSGNVATTVTVGTNGVGSSPWWAANTYGYSPLNVSIAVELVSGAVNFTAQYTYDDPNNLDGGLIAPLPFPLSTMTAASATADAQFVAGWAMRVLINSGTGVIRARFLQIGNG